MVYRQGFYELIRKRRRQSWVAIGEMRNEIDKVSKGYDAGVRCRGRSLEEQFSLCLILIILRFEIGFVGALQVSHMREAASS